MAVSRSFSDLVAGYLKADPDATFKLLTRWAPHENTKARFNPLATTQDASGASNFNSVGVKDYPDEATGAMATAKTISNGLYPNIMRFLREKIWDATGIQGDLNTWVTGRRDGQGYSLTLDGNETTGGTSMPPTPQGDAAGLRAEIWQEIVHLTRQRPDQKNYVVEGTTAPDAKSYNEALSAWDREYRAMFSAYNELAKTMASEDPEAIARAREKAALDLEEQRQRLIVQGFSVKRSVANDLNALEQDKLDNAIKKANTSLAFDNASLANATRAIDRQLEGLQESRTRAADITSAQLEARPWATSPGKLGFSGADLGSVASALASFLGLDPNSELIRYPTEVVIDPQGLMGMYDEQFGVTGQLPGVPGMITSPDMITGMPNPNFISPPGPPDLPGGSGYISPPGPGGFMPDPYSMYQPAITPPPWMAGLQGVYPEATPASSSTLAAAPGGSAWAAWNERIRKARELASRMG